jgi:DNA-binding MarR family transcriptional regulator
MTPRARARPAAAPRRNEIIPLEQIVHIAEFRSTLRAFLRRTERVARGVGLTPQRFELLLAIKGAPDGSQRLNFTSLANRLHLSRNTVTELCARAEDAGLLARERDPGDQRVIYLRLTKKADKLLCAALIENDAFRHELMHAFGDLRRSFATSAAGPVTRR